MMKNRKGQLGYSISLKDALRQGGFYNKDGIWNSLLKMDGHILRGRVETIVIKKDEQQMFAHIKDYDKKKYRLPGGSFENGIPNIRQAENEVHEEARIKIKNLINSNQHYIRLYPNPTQYVKNECIDWEGNYNEIYVAEYDGPYDDYIRKKDRDDDMYQKGRFYDINYIYPILDDAHKEVIDGLFPNRKETVQIDSPLMTLGVENANRRIYPYYTPIEMNNLGVFKETTNRYSDIEDEAIDWYHEYVDTLQNPDSENWYKELQYRYENYKKEPTLENRQLILNLGWNPEVQVTFENVLKASKETEKRINEGVFGKKNAQYFVADNRDARSVSYKLSDSEYSAIALFGYSNGLKSSYGKIIYDNNDKSVLSKRVYLFKVGKLGDKLVAIDTFEKMCKRYQIELSEIDITEVKGRGKIFDTVISLIKKEASKYSDLKNNIDYFSKDEDWYQEFISGESNDTEVADIDVWKIVPNARANSDLISSKVDKPVNELLKNIKNKVPSGYKLELDGDWDEYMIILSVDKK